MSLLTGPARAPLEPLRVDAAPVLARARVRWRVHIDHAAGVLEWRLHVEPDHARGEGVLVRSDHERPIASFTHHGASLVRRGGLEHLDIPGTLALSVRRGPPVEILYARTSLLALAGVAGGRWEILPLEV